MTKKEKIPADVAIAIASALGRYLKDDKGSYVNSRLDEETLQKIAKLTDGDYFRVDPKQFGVERVLQAVQKLKRGEAQTRLVVEPRELYHLFLFPGFFALVIETALSDRRRRREVTTPPPPRGKGA